MRTIVFAMFSTYQASQSRSHFPPKPLRKQLPNHNVDFHIQNHKIVSKLSPKCVPKDSKNSSDTATSPCLCPTASQEVSPSVPGPAKWMPGVLKWSLGVLKTVVVVVRKMIPSSRQPINSHLASRSNVGELPDERGAGGRGKALKYTCQKYACRKYFVSKVSANCSHKPWQYSACT